MPIKTDKIIIKNETENGDLVVILELLCEVIKVGRVSNRRRSYCYSTVFPEQHIIIHAVRNSRSDCFYIMDLPDGYANLRM